MIARWAEVAGAGNLFQETRVSARIGVLEALRKKKAVVAVCGGFDPIHIGHVRHLKEAKELIEAGFEHVTHMDGVELFRKPK